jgi:hypothetical protein
MVRGQAVSLVAELSRKGRGLRGQEVLGDTDSAHQTLNLYQRRHEWEGQWRIKVSNPLPVSLVPDVFILQ